MTSPPQDITVECPRCSHRYRALYRPSINLSLGESWSDEEVEEATTATCPACGVRILFDLVAFDVTYSRRGVRSLAL